jgi:MbtH protein
MVAQAEPAGAGYRVVVNDEEQYSVWPVGRDVPGGWRSVGVTGSREQCLAHIDRVWTDITPLSVRTARDEARAAAGEGRR